MEDLLRYPYISNRYPFRYPIQIFNYLSTIYPKISSSILPTYPKDILGISNYISILDIHIVSKVYPLISIGYPIQISKMYPIDIQLISNYDILNTSLDIHKISISDFLSISKNYPIEYPRMISNFDG
jgi:hypothetical protein